MGLHDELLRRVRAALAEPRARGVDVDGPRRVQVHRDILRTKPLIREVFADIYRHCRRLDETHLSGSGLRLEVGAGSSFIRDVLPDVFSSDLEIANHLDLAVDAHALPLPAGSLRALYGINCFHHFPDPDRFFAELERALVPGGGAVLVDPYYGTLARFFYARLFEQEHFDTSQRGWTSDTSAMTAMKGANQALSYIVFVRDRALLAQRHPGLEVVHAAPFSGSLRYLLSGGVNFRSLWPPSMGGVLRAAEAALNPWLKQLALHHAIVIRKRS